jgi:cell wall-associated NlpC family hydrolase
MACPRDSDMQEEALGSPRSADFDGTAPRRGDLVFWSGHVAIVRDRSTLLHANAFHMAVAIEPIAQAIARIRGGGSEITSVRRIETAVV